MIQPLINFLKIIRWKNVLIYLFLQFTLYFVIIKKDFNWTDGWFFLVFAMTFFGIFGNIQNNLTDYQVDRHKKEFVPFNQTIYLIWMLIFLVLAFLFAFTGFYMSFKPNLLYVVVSVPVLLSFYNYYLKKIALAGNIIIAFLTALAIYIPLFFSKDIHIAPNIFIFLLTMSFALTLLRELAKDLEDMPFDRQAGYQTLPVINEDFSRVLLGLLSVGMLVLMCYFKTTFNSHSYGILLLLSIIFVIVSFWLLYKKQYEWLTKLYKFWMLIGIIAVIFIAKV